MTSAGWREVWDQWPRRHAAGDHLRQVAKTVNGVVIDAGQVEAMTAEVTRRLRLAPSDVLLDLCCGNGLLTARLAARCGRVVGVDFSAPLLEVARRDHRPGNVSYQHASVLDLDRLPLSPGSFTKVLFYDALQHFSAVEFRRLLALLVPLLAEERLVLVGGVPYRPYRHRWLDTPARQSRYWARRLTGRDRFGTWWRHDDVARACTAVGLQCARHDQPPGLYNARFRVDFTAW